MIRYLLLLAGAGLWTGAAYLSEAPQAAAEVLVAAEPRRTSAAEEPSPEPRPSEPRAEPQVVPEPEPELSRRLVIPFAPGYVTFEVASVAADIAEFASHTKTDLDCLLAVRVYSAPEEIGARARFLANRRLELVRDVVLGEGMPERRVQLEPTPETQSPDGVFAHVELERVGDCQ